MTEKNTLSRDFLHAGKLLIGIRSRVSSLKFDLHLSLYKYISSNIARIALSVPYVVVGLYLGKRGQH